jgi:deoxyribose-phosphate aldolase
MITKEQFAKMIDHSVLDPDTNKKLVDQYIQETIKYGFGTCYVPWCDVAYAKSIIKNKARVGVGAGFPLGYSTTKVKIVEGIDGIENGADKVDVVLNIYKIKSGDFDYVEKELSEFCKAMKEKKPDVIISSIIETCYLTHNEKIKACEIVRDCKSDYIKTSTGTGPRGGNIGDIRLMKKICGKNIGLKVAAIFTGIEDVLAYIEEGVTVFGDNSGVRWMEEWDEAVV